MSNKSLIIKSPSTIDADLLIWNALKITWSIKANSKGGGYDMNQIGPFSSDDSFEITKQGLGTTVKLSKKQQYGGITISPDTSDITEVEATITGNDVFDITLIGGDYSKFTIKNIENVFGKGFDAIKHLTNLEHLDLYQSNIYGDIAELNALTNLKYLDIDAANIYGNIAELKALTNLIELDLSHGVYGDVAELKDLTNLRVIYMTASKGVSGDFSTLTNVQKISASLNDKGASWTSPTARSSKTNIPLYLYDGKGDKGLNFGDYLDNFLIDEAACTNYSGNAYGKSITVSGNRTSASDSAIETLQNNGWTVKIN